MSNEVAENKPVNRPQEVGRDRPSFHQSSVEVITLLRAALLEAIGFDDRPVQKSRDLQRRFGVSLNLSWQVYRVATSADASECGALIPTPAPMRKLITAIRKHGGDEDDIAALENAYAAFENFVELHAGDRARFNMMITQTGGSRSLSQIDLTHRRAVFDAYRHFSGVEVGMLVLCDILHPGLISGQWDYAFLRLRNDLRRLNYLTPMTIDSRVFLKTQANEFADDIHALDEEAFARYGIPIIPRFCSTVDLPLQQFENNATGLMSTQWTGDAVGKLSSIDVAFGEIRRNTMQIRRSGNRAGISTGTVIINPVRTAIRDTLIHRAYFGKVQTELSLWNHSTGKETTLERLENLGLQRLGCRDRVSFVGGGAAAAYTPEAPQYVDFLRYTCQKLGWQLEDFDVYRSRVEYPLIHTLQVCDFTFSDLPFLGKD